MTIFSLHHLYRTKRTNFRPQQTSSQIALTDWPFLAKAWVLGTDNAYSAHIIHLDHWLLAALAVGTAGAFVAFVSVIARCLLREGRAYSAHRNGLRLAAAASLDPLRCQIHLEFAASHLAAKNKLASEHKPYVRAQAILAARVQDSHGEVAALTRHIS